MSPFIPLSLPSPSPQRWEIMDTADRVKWKQSVERGTLTYGKSPCSLSEFRHADIMEFYRAGVRAPRAAEELLLRAGIPLNKKRLQAKAALRQYVNVLINPRTSREQELEAIKLLAETFS